jgi:hypothetical protein
LTLVIFERVSFFMPGAAQTTILLFMLRFIAGMTGTHQHFSHWMS